MSASQPPGWGVLPDYPVAQSLADFIAGRDPQLALALKLLAEQVGGSGLAVILVPLPDTVAPAL